jgi:hypothetical protein
MSEVFRKMLKGFHKERRKEDYLLLRFSEHS